MVRREAKIEAQREEESEKKAIINSEQSGQSTISTKSRRKQQMTKILIVLAIVVVVLIAVLLGHRLRDKTKNKTPTSSPTTVPTVPKTSASAITSPPPSMEGINTHTELYGTGADPDIITLGPKVGGHPEKTPYAGKHSMSFEAYNRGSPVLAPIDMALVGFQNDSVTSGIGADGQEYTPFDGLQLWFESASPDWPSMIFYVYHLYSSPLLLGYYQNPDCGVSAGRGENVQAQGHLYFDSSDYVTPEKGNAGACKALIGYAVKRGELIGFAGSVGTHSFADFGFKVSDTSVNPTVQKGNHYLHWVQPGSFFYWKCHNPDANFPSGVLAYPFECDGYQLPAEQHEVNFKYTSKKGNAIE